MTQNEKYVTTATGIRYSKEYCLEIIRRVIDPDSELYDDIKFYIETGENESA